VLEREQDHGVSSSPEFAAARLAPDVGSPASHTDAGGIAPCAVLEAQVAERVDRCGTVSGELLERVGDSACAPAVVEQQGRELRVRLDLGRLLLQGHKAREELVDGCARRAVHMPRMSESLPRLTSGRVPASATARHASTATWAPFWCSTGASSRSAASDPCGASPAASSTSATSAL
jgi:hypothetical protein